MCAHVRVSTDTSFGSLGIIPKASSAARIKENSELFDFQLSQEDKDTLNVSLDQSHHFCWDPNGVA